MAEKKNAGNSGSGFLKKRNSTETNSKKKVKKVAESTKSVENSSVNSAELQKTKEIKTVAAATAVKDKEADKKLQKATAGSSVKTTKTKKAKKEKLGINWFFWLVVILIIIPVGYFVKLLHDASLEGNVPVVGDRLKHNLQFVISDEQLDSIRGSVGSMENVERYEVNLIVDTLRITVDASDDLTSDQLKEMTKSIYAIVDENAPVDTYFVQHDDYKQYDMEINAFTDLDAETPIIVSLYRNSNMENYAVQDLTSPLNKKIADRLKEEMQKELEEEERERQQQEAQNNQNGEETEQTEETTEQSGESDSD